MNQDEQAIRDLVDRWLAAGKKGDLATLMPMMADDVIFMVPGVPAFGKATFAANSEKMKGATLEAQSDIQEIEVLGDRAWMRNHLRVKFTPPGGTPKVLSGYILTILRKDEKGNWQIARDANLLVPENAG